jgi:lipid-A-disaccharide synthase
VKGQFFGMANLILNEAVAPEFFQEAATPENLSEALLKFLKDEKYRDQTKAKLRELKNRLGEGGAISHVVDELESVLK